MDQKLISGTVDMMILEVAVDGPTYGYAVTQAVLQRSEGKLELKEGSLYPALHRLERTKLLTSEWREVEGRRRKYYRLTPAGKKTLQARKQDWLEFSQAVGRVLGENYGLT